MARKVFYSFHFNADNSRASQVRNIGALEGNQPVSDNDWEAVKKGGDEAIENWIKAQLVGKTCTVVLIGKETSERKWVWHEISESWNENKGVLGIYIHNLRDLSSQQTTKGNNPFAKVTFRDTGKSLAEVVKTYDPPYTDSKQVYAYISSNIESWVEAAIKQREN